MRGSNHDSKNALRGRGGAAALRMVAALVLVLGAFTVGPLASASEHKIFTAKVEPANVAGGAFGVTFTATLKNKSPEHQLGSADITAPTSPDDGFVIPTNQALQPQVNGVNQGTASVSGNKVQLRDLAAPPDATITVEFSANTPCGPGSGTWGAEAKQANNFRGSPGNNLILLTDDPDTSLTVNVAACDLRLEFITQPADSEKNTFITSEVGNPTGEPIKVAVVDGSDNVVASSSAEITLGIGVNPPGDGAFGNGSVTVVSAVNGVATFDMVKITKAGVGYTLTADSPGIDDTESDAFTIYDDLNVTHCSPEQFPCTSSSSFGPHSVSVTGKGGPQGGTIFTSIGGVQIECTGGFNHAPTTATIEPSNLDPDTFLAVTVTIAKQFVQQFRPNDGAAFFALCFAYPEETGKTFVDMHGNTVPAGEASELPSCDSQVPQPPCVTKLAKTQKGDILIEALLLAEDPWVR